jgi:hypothetical protein
MGERGGRGFWRNEPYIQASEDSGLLRRRLFHHPKIGWAGNDNVLDFLPEHLFHIVR